MQWRTLSLFELEVEFELGFEVFGGKGPPGFAWNEILDFEVASELKLAFEIAICAVNDLPRVIRSMWVGSEVSNHDEMRRAKKTPSIRTHLLQ